ncbi:MAG: glycoside hydrolase, partial [Limnothrix sp.]
VRGLWPSEQSVSPEVLDPIAAAGFKWICSDEAVLGWSLQHFFHRDEVGNVYEPEMMYQPYRLETPSGDLSIVFRDHRLSDLVGFTYSGMEAEAAASDLVGHLEAIARKLRNNQEGGETSLQKPHLVTIALDGENCWEFYERDGIPFLTSLYEKLSANRQLELVTVSEFIEQFPPTKTIPREKLHSGSWVDGSFTTWIGDPAKNRAWDLLYKARKTLEAHPEATEETNPEAWESLFAAEGSDWFWWFGEGHSSNQDAMFDRLFREHVAGIYKALNEPIPPEVKQPIEKHNVKQEHVPLSFIHPVVDGVGDEQDWDKAGCIEIGGARGTMHQSSTLQRLYYGWDHLNFYLRFDLKRGVQWSDALPSELHLLCFYPGINCAISPAPIASMPEKEPLNYLFRHHIGINMISKSIWFEEATEYGKWRSRAIHAKMAYKECLELSVPWDVLDAKPDLDLQMVAILADEGEYDSFVPENQFVTLRVP